MCLVVEAFVIPGFGLVGILGIVVLVGDAVYAWLTIGPLAGAVVLLLAATSGGAGVYLVMHTRLGKRFRLASDLSDSRSAVSVGREGLVGAQGEAVTTLRPAGVVLIDGQRVDATTGGELIEKGTRIRVVVVEGPRIVVRATEDGEARTQLCQERTET